jgi:hypothetical protein
VGPYVPLLEFKQLLIQGTLTLAIRGASFDADMRALLEGSGVPRKLSPDLDAVPFGSELSYRRDFPRALSVLRIGRLGGDRKGRDGLSVRGRFGFGVRAEEADSVQLY